MTVLTDGSNSSYALMDKLGEGNFSSVFKAHCLGPRRGFSCCCPVARATDGLGPVRKLPMTREGHHLVAVKRLRHQLSKSGQQEYFYSPSLGASSFFAVTPLRKDGQLMLLGNASGIRERCKDTKRSFETATQEVCSGGMEENSKEIDRSLCRHQESPTGTVTPLDTSKGALLTSFASTTQRGSMMPITPPEVFANCIHNLTLSEASARASAERETRNSTSHERRIEERCCSFDEPPDFLPPRSRSLGRIDCSSVDSAAVTTTAGSTSTRHSENRSASTSQTTEEVGKNQAVRAVGDGRLSLENVTWSARRTAVTPAKSSLFASKEISALQKLNPHSHIIQMFDCFVDRNSGQLCIVTELMERSLLELLESFSGNGMSESLVRSLLFQALLAVDHVHKHDFIHRDIKPENFLVCSNGSTLKLADFGCCRTLSKSPPYTEYIATRWYRPPECLMSPGGYYSKQMDIWGLGCLMFELLTGRPLFPGRDESEQLQRIELVLGPLPGHVCKSPESILLALKIAQRNSNSAIRLRSMLYVDCSNAAVDLLQGLLAYDPITRMDSSSALSHCFFDAVRAPGLGTSNPVSLLHRWDQARQLVDSRFDENGRPRALEGDFADETLTTLPNKSKDGRREDKVLLADACCDAPQSQSLNELSKEVTVKCDSAEMVQDQGGNRAITSLQKRSTIVGYSFQAVTIPTSTPPPRQKASPPTDSPEITDSHLLDRILFTHYECRKPAPSRCLQKLY